MAGPGGYLEPGEDPLEAIQRELLEETGYESEEWGLLGSYVKDANRRVSVGHFFLARNARKTTEPNNNDLEQMQIRWVSAAEARRALRDGRIVGMSYAINITLALLSLQNDY